MKAEQPDRKTLQLIVLQLLNYFALLRYLRFPSVRTNPISDTSVENSATSSPINPKRNANRNCTSIAHLLPCATGLSINRFTPEEGMGPPDRKQKILQLPTSNHHPTHGKLLQLRRTSKNSELRKLFADEISTYTSITAGIHSQYFFLYEETRQLEGGNSDAIICKIPSVKFVFDSAKIAQPSPDPLIELATSFRSLFSGLIPMDTTFSSNSTPMVLDPLLTKVHHFYSPSSLVTTATYSNGSSRSSSILVSVIN